MSTDFYLLGAKLARDYSSSYILPVNKKTRISRNVAGVKNKSKEEMQQLFEKENLTAAQTPYTYGRVAGKAEEKAASSDNASLSDFLSNKLKEQKPRTLFAKSPLAGQINNVAITQVGKMLPALKRRAFMATIAASLLNKGHVLGNAMIKTGPTAIAKTNQLVDMVSSPKGMVLGGAVAANTPFVSSGLRNKILAGTLGGTGLATGGRALFDMLTQNVTAPTK